MSKQTQTITKDADVKLTKEEASNGRLINIDAQDGNKTITMPDNPVDGQNCYIKKKGGSNSVTLASSTVPTTPSIEVTALAADNDVVHFQYDAVSDDWAALSQNIA